MSLNQIKKLRQHLYKKLVKYSTTPVRNKAVNVCQFSSVQSLSCVQLFATPWTAARQAALSITNSRSLLKLIFIESVIPSNHLIICRPLLLLPSIFPSIRVFPNESVLEYSCYLTLGKLSREIFQFS